MCPSKGVPSLERFYTRPFTNVDDAEAKYKEIQGELDKHDVHAVAELLMIDKTTVENSDWYKANMQVVERMPNFDFAKDWDKVQPF